MRDSRQKAVSPWDSAISPRKTTKRRGTRSNQTDSGNPKCPRVDVTIIFCEDAAGWDTYLTDFLNYFHESPQSRRSLTGSSSKLVIRQEKLETVELSKISPADAKAISTSRATLVILSPAFLNHIESHADVYELCKLLKPVNTVAMLCGVADRDIGSLHRAALVSYDAWPRLVAKNTDNEFVLTLVHTLQDVLAKSQDVAQLINKHNLKLTPRKVKEGHNKVFLLMEQPLDTMTKIQVFLEGDGVREVTVNQRNPYTLQFIVPETYLKVSKILNVHIRCQGQLLGVLPLKVESLMGELSTILSSVDSPYELLCRTLGLDSRHQVDSFLTEQFKQRLPEGFDTAWITPHSSMVKTNSIKEELPTLLHFSACYGLKLFTKTLLECPGGNLASSIKNARGLTPSQLANYAGHNDLAALLNDAQRVTRTDTLSPRQLGYENITATMGWSIDNQSYVNMPSDNEDSSGGYPSPQSIPEFSDKVEDQLSPTEAQADIPPPWEETYLPMQPIMSKSCLLPHQLITPDDCLQLTQCKNQDEFQSLVEAEPEVEEVVEQAQATSTDSSNQCFTESQNKLAKILESFKLGRTIEDIEKDVNEWRKKNSIPLQEEEESLSQLRKEYEKKNVEKSPKNRKKGLLDFFPSKSRADKKKNTLSVMVNSTSNTSLSSLENMDTVSTTFHKKPLPTPRITLNLDDFNPSRPNSTISSSGSSTHSRASTASNLSNLSMGSVYDSGNQTDSCEETNSKHHAYVNQSVIARSVITKALHRVPPVPPSRHTTFPSKPPAPPPRFRILTKANDEEEHYSHPRHNFDLCTTTKRPSQPEERFSLQEYVGPDYASACYHQCIQNLTANNMTKAQSNQSLNARVGVSTCDDEECYWIPPPPIPIYRKASAPSLTFQQANFQELEYDVPKPTVVFTPTKLEGSPQFLNSECHYYSIPRSVQTTADQDTIPSEPPPPPPTT